MNTRITTAMNKCIYVGVMTASLCFGIANNAAAQTKTAASSDGTFYGRISAGAAMPNDTGYSISGSASGYGVTATGTVSGDVKWKAGKALTGGVGYRLSKMFSIEGELGYADADLDSASVNVAGTLTSGGSNLAVTANTDVDLKGNASAVTGMVNLIANTPNFENVAPYLGVGLGFVNWEIELDSISQGGTTLTVNGSESGTDLAASFIAGADLSLGSGMAGGLRYKYLWTDTGTAITDDVTAHVIQASFRIDF